MTAFDFKSEVDKSLSVKTLSKDFFIENRPQHKLHVTGTHTQKMIDQLPLFCQYLRICIYYRKSLQVRNIFKAGYH